jgi:hypothetical protein
VGLCRRFAWTITVVSLVLATASFRSTRANLGIDTDTAEWWCSACLSINVIHEVSE